LLGGHMKGLGMSMSVHSISDKESPEKQQLSKYKEPYAELGAFVVSVFVMMCNTVCHRVQL
jgi:hypothetical protein